MESNAYKLASERIKEAGRTGAARLDLSGMNLEELPAGIGELTGLRVLNIGFNRLKRIPDEVTRLIYLKELYASNNELSDLPGEINKLVNLEIVDLAGNSFKSFPAGFEAWTALRMLSFGSSLDKSKDEVTQRAGNFLSSVPTDIGALINLEHLDLSNSWIERLPPQIGKLKKLKELRLENNKLIGLPDEIGELSSLEILNLGSFWDERTNNIHELPLGMQNLTRLKFLGLSGNPLPIPPEILKKYYQAQVILSYYFARRTQPLNEIKLIVVGQGSVGKTSLINRLTANKFNSAEIKTDGIAINQWMIEGQDQRVRINIWDFGGQEIMHATHQFFLTKRSIYVLVLDSRLTQEENRVEYWLKLIQSFGGDSPVIVVGNKIDQHPLDIDRTGLKRKYANIAGVLEVSAATGIGIHSLSSFITDQIFHLPYVFDLLPTTWFAIKSSLERMGRQQNFVTQDVYLQLCQENGVSDEVSQRTLIGFLHDLGVILHFQDDPRLEDLGILNPEWVTNGVYKILNSHALFQNRGVLPVRMLDAILNLPEYPRGKRLFIIDMMRKFELCYDIEPDKTFLVPDLLPKDEPFTGDWKGALTFQYHYNVLPSSIISRFIVRMNTYIDKTVWRSGVVLRKGGNHALVRADTEENKIHIGVCGDELSRRDLLSAIRTELDAIHRTIIKIEAIEKVPHPDYPNLVFDYIELLQFERDGIAEFPKSIDGKTIMVSVQRLLNGISEPGIRQHTLRETFLRGVYVQAENLYIGGQHATNQVNTQGGAYVRGNVDTGGGDFTGRDHTSVSLAFQDLKKLAHDIEDADTRDEVQSAIARIEKETQKSELADEKKIRRWLNFLAEAAPDVWKAIIAIFANPIAGIDPIFQKAVKQVKEGREQSNGAD